MECVEEMIKENKEASNKENDEIKEMLKTIISKMN